MGSTVAEVLWWGWRFVPGGWRLFLTEAGERAACWRAGIVKNQPKPPGNPAYFNFFFCLVRFGEAKEDLCSCRVLKVAMETGVHPAHLENSSWDRQEAGLLRVSLFKRLSSLTSKSVQQFFCIWPYLVFWNTYYN